MNKQKLTMVLTPRVGREPVEVMYIIKGNPWFANDGLHFETVYRSRDKPPVLHWIPTLRILHYATTAVPRFEPPYGGI